MEPHVFRFASSPFVPIAIGFFGLGTGYLVWGEQALFQLITGFWLLYCTYAITVNLALGAKAWI